MCCNDPYNDNRESCTDLTPSSCVPYVGYVSDLIKDGIPCRPNINDIFKLVQELIENIKSKIGDNTKLDNSCLNFDPETVTQSELNQLFIDTLCLVKKWIDDYNPSIDATTLMVTANILCLENDPCDPKTQYSAQELFNKLIIAYCDLLTRVKNIENILNI